MTEKKPFLQESSLGMLRRTAQFIGGILLAPFRSPETPRKR